MVETKWETPQAFFDTLNDEFRFTVDVCAIPQNAKCKMFYHPIEDALSREWHGICWMNPPYGRGQNVYAWVKKAFNTSIAGGIVVCLLPASTDTKWFHDFCMKASEIRFIRDRLWFSRGGDPKRSNHASMIVIFRPECGTLKISSIDNCHNKITEQDKADGCEQI